MIDKLYIKESMRIRDEYISSLKKILDEEDIINEKKKEIESLKGNIEELIKIDMNDVTKRLKLNNTLNGIDKLMKDIQTRIQPHYDHIENLRTDADKLYNSIREKYPNIDEEEMKNELYPYLEIIDQKI